MGGAADETEPHARLGSEWFRFGWAVLAGAATRTSDDAESNDVVDIDEVREAFHGSLDADSAFAALAANAGLSVVDAETFAVLAASEADANCRTFVSAISGNERITRLTLGTLSGLFDETHPGALTVAVDSALRRTAFVDVIGRDGAWVDHVVALHPGVVWALLGDTSLDADLPAGLEFFDANATLDPTMGTETADLVLVNGADRMRRRLYGATHATGQRFLCSPSPTSDLEWSALVREATISGRGIIVEVGNELAAIGKRWIDRASHLAWVLSSASGPPLDELPQRPRVDVTAPSDDPTDAEWVAVLGPDVERTHHLTFDQLDRVGRAAKGLSHSGSLSNEQFDAAVRRLASGRLDRLTQRIRPTRTWEDLVVGADDLSLLLGIADRYVHSAKVYDDWGFASTPSRGLVALFSGPSGTGKTLASEIIAGELGLDLFKLDLSSVVSKYIGETEKNLEQIFDAASAGNLVLFFDEADSLFGKRSEVKDSRDRYANVEVSYLLQRLERYDGLVVMATNFEKNIDEAFLRRIHVRVPFTLPEVPERAAIWRSNFPAIAPVDDLDIDWLATQFPLSGGSIRNAAVHAAFHAAATDDHITMKSIVIGVANEFRKMGRLVKAADFGEYHDIVGNG